MIQGVLAQISMQKEVDQFGGLPENKFASVSICIIDLDKDKSIDNTCSATATAFAVAVISRDILLFLI